MRLLTTRRSVLQMAGMLAGLGPTRGMAADREHPDLLKLRGLLSLPEAEIDYGSVKLAIDKIVDPSADLGRAERQIGALFREAAALCGYSFARQVSVEARVDALRTCLYRRGPWNENRPFRYDLENDPTGKEILENNLLPTYLDKRLGNCVSMPMLFLVLAQRMGVDACLSTAPEHVFVKVRAESGAYTNHECTHDGGLKADGSYVREFEITPEAVKLGTYLRPLSKKEGILVMAEVLGSHYFRKEDVVSLRAFADYVSEANPGSLQAIHWTTAVYGLTLNAKFKNRYLRYEDIPPHERDEVRRLLRTIRDLDAKAHVLGWRPVSAEFERNYRKLVSGAKRPIPEGRKNEWQRYAIGGPRRCIGDKPPSGEPLPASRPDRTAGRIQSVPLRGCQPIDLFRSVGAADLINPRRTATRHHVDRSSNFRWAWNCGCSCGNRRLSRRRSGHGGWRRLPVGDAGPGTYGDRTGERIG